MQRLFTFGYLTADASEKLTALLVHPSVVLLDIRRSPASRIPMWRRAALEQRYGSQYRHIPELGNVNYRDHRLPIVLADQTAGLSLVLPWLQEGYEPCLLCACASVEFCHRLVVAQLVQACFSCEVVHL